jgi:thiosulfate reductase cytochrome b subunit
MAMTSTVKKDEIRQQASGSRNGRLVTRQRLSTRVTHWIWAICLFFLLLSGLQIFNAHPALYIGKESGFSYENSVLEIGSDQSGDSPKGITTLFGHSLDTTGLLGISGSGDDLVDAAFPAWLTIPASRDLATGRVVHFFFAWIFVATLLAWFLASLRNRHLRKDLLPRRSDVTGLWADVRDHLRFKFHHGVRYTPLQKLAYAGVLFVLFPLIVLTGISMSPGLDAVFPWLPGIFGGRQTARTIHFVTMSLLVLFFFIHIAMILAAGPLNEIRSIITGRYRLSAAKTRVNKNED